MRRLGRWDHSRIVQHYSSGLPRGVARRIAGHFFEEGISRLTALINEYVKYFRELINPPEELQRRVFPWIVHAQASNDIKGSQGDCALEPLCNLLPLVPNCHSTRLFNICVI
jgi:hypothetical protein